MSLGFILSAKPSLVAFFSLPTVSFDNVIENNLPTAWGTFSLPLLRLAAFPNIIHCWLKQSFNKIGLGKAAQLAYLVESLLIELGKMEKSIFKKIN